jgi:hypothetical protein
MLTYWKVCGMTIYETEKEDRKLAIALLEARWALNVQKKLKALNIENDRKGKPKLTNIITSF